MGLLFRLLLVAAALASLGARAAAVDSAGPSGADGPGAVAREPASVVADYPRALAAARALAPDARWLAGQAQAADFTADGRTDLALLGQDGAAAVVVVVSGPGMPRPRAFALRIAGGDEQPEGAGCASGEGQLRAERPLPAGPCPASEAAVCAPLVEWSRRARAFGALGLRLDAPGCEPVHLFFDGRALQVWRGGVAPRAAAPAERPPGEAPLDRPDELPAEEHLASVPR